MNAAHTRLDVAGITVDVSASSNYLSFVTDRVGELTSDSSPDIELIIGRDVPVLPSHPADQRMEMIDAWFDESTLWMRMGSAVARVTGRRLVIGGSIGNAFDYKSIDLLVQFGVSAVCADRDRIMIHAAVLARGDHALIVVGKSGAGKSTASTAALVRGWDLLTDDLAVAYPLGGLIRGVARPPRLPSEVAAAHGIFSGRTEPGPRGRVILDASVLATGTKRMVGLVMVGHGEEGSLERVRSGDLHAIDDALAVPPFRPVMRRHLAPAAALAALPTFVLRHARDETVRLDRAAMLLDQALDSALKDGSDQ